MKTIDKYTSLNKNYLFEIQHFNNTNSTFPEKTLTCLFEEQVNKTPHNIAAIFNDTKATYIELNRKANKIARYLKDNGLGPKTCIAICLNKSLNALIYMLAALKAGASYVFVDPNYPLERIYLMVRNPQCRFVISSLGMKDHLISSFISMQEEDNRKEKLAIDVFGVEEVEIELEGYSGDNLPSVNTIEDLAYIIFTSGSTGVPKAVMVQHNSIVNCIFSIRNLISFKEHDVSLLLASLSFDISVVEYFLPWLSGARVVIADEQVQKNPELLCNLIVGHNITFMQATPTTWQMLNNFDWCGKEDLKAVTAGEPISMKLATEILSKVQKLYNGYGPTEATIYTTMGELKANTNITIGKPITNCKVYITDKSFNLMPVGLVGELCVSGLGIARGYIDNEKLKENSFLNDNPFITKNEKNKERYGRIYRTGDQARYLQNGDIEYLGRADQQVKIYGQRVDLIEIETNLLQNHLLNTCAVIAKPGLNLQNVLIAYVVPKDLSVLNNKQEAHRDLVSFLKSKLPEYMIPNNFVFLDSLPLTSSGKIDRKKLGKFALTRPALLIKYYPPITNTEKTVHAIWKEVFQIDDIGVDDNFFDLGGYSLLVTQIYNLLKKNNFHISIVDIFQNPTIRLFSKQVDIYNKNKGA